MLRESGGCEVGGLMEEDLGPEMSDAALSEDLSKLLLSWKLKRALVPVDAGDWIAGEKFLRKSR